MASKTRQCRYWKAGVRCSNRYAVPSTWPGYCSPLHRELMQLKGRVEVIEAVKRRSKMSRQSVKKELKSMQFDDILLFDKQEREFLITAPPAELRAMAAAFAERFGLATENALVIFEQLQTQGRKGQPMALDVTLSTVPLH